jgi:hypothetical protein
MNFLQMHQNLRDRQVHAQLLSDLVDHHVQVCSGQLIACIGKERPKGLCGMYQSHTKDATIILKAVASHDLWIWHAFFGMLGSHNDINVLQRSLIFRSLCNGETSPCSYTVNGRDYNMGYYLADGIYPQWVVFVKKVFEPQDNKQSHKQTPY